MTAIVYMDHHATTPVDPRVLEAMLPFFTEKFGNAASRNHAFGWDAAQACDRARRQVAERIGAREKDVVFTSGATESDNLAIKGALDANADRGNHIVTCATEHRAVLDTCRSLERKGKAVVTYLGVNGDGSIDLDALRRAITDRTVLLSFMHANNEIGTVHPVAEIGRIAKERGVLFHTDAAQSAGVLPIDVEAMGIDLLSVSAHKMYGPKGCGALYVRSKAPRVRLTPLLDGGGHERGLRSGTLNVPGVVGLGKACELAGREGEDERIAAMRDRLWDGIRSRLDGVRLNGPLAGRLPGNLNVTFAHVEGESLLLGLRHVAVSSGSACSSATMEPSHVLRAIGATDEQAHSSIRFGLGRFNTDEEVDLVVERLVHEVKRLRDMSPGYAASSRGRRPH